MACSLYNNGGFGCGSCLHFVRSTNVTAANNTLIIDIPTPLVSVTNKQKICVCLIQAIPTDVLPTGAVKIRFNGTGTQYNVLTKCGNIVRADQMRSRKLYHFFVATDTPAFVVSSCELCPTSYNYPVITP